MNLLGHLYFSNNDPELMYSNLFGDFVKGRSLDRFSEDVQIGIRLHRAIDHYIDNHVEVKNLMRFLYRHLPKVSSVAIDLYFDHLLAKNWHQYHEKSFVDFLETFYRYYPRNGNEFTPDFNHFTELMRKNKWLNYYPYFDGLEKACAGVSSRISFPNSLTKAPLIFQKNEEKITTCFFIFMEDASHYFNQTRFEF